MGRQQYLIRLALGRSPYEAPESSNGDVSPHNTSGQYRENPNNSGDYVQQYDERGHPTFPRSKTLARDLRRAKNDVLSTMGVVVSGETARPGSSREKQRVKSIMAENDYGLLVVAFDNFVSFFGSWWISSLMGRVQIYKKYSHGSLWDILQSEINNVGWKGALFAGMPTFVVMVIFPIFRLHVFEPLMTKLQQKLSRSRAGRLSLAHNAFSLLRLSVRSSLYFLLEEQIYLFRYLQTQHLIPFSAFPTLSFLTPFTESSLIRYPSFPTAVSLSAFKQLASDLFAGPFALGLTHALLQGFIRDKIYRIIRRRLPKQEKPDELSVQVAVDNDLLDWTIPTAGRNMEYEAYRSNLSLLDDIKEEFRDWKKQVLNWLRWDRAAPTDKKRYGPYNWDNAEPAHNRNQLEAERQNIDGATMSTLVQSSFDGGRGQILANEQLTHSPAQITPVSLDGLRPVGQTTTHATTRGDNYEGSWLPPQDNDQRSRSNTLLSRPASPESPLTSPRIRASLTHQNSFTTTMEISLQSSRNRRRIEQVDADVANLDATASLEDFNIDAVSRDLIVQRMQALDTWATDTEAEERGAREHAGVEDSTANILDASELVEILGDPHPETDDTLGATSNENTLIPALPPVITPVTVLPDTVEEPPHSPITLQENMELGSGAEAQGMQRSRSPPQDRPTDQQRQQQGNDDTVVQQRVTVLSSFPMDSLAQHLSSLITSVLFIPYRSLFYRSLATSYLSTPAASVFSRDIAVSSTNIRPLNAFAGGGSRHDMVGYMGKLAMIIGIQTALSGGILSISSALAMEIGKRMFRWGQL